MKNLQRAAAVTMATGGLIATGAGIAAADSGAQGAAKGSPGVVSGNTIQAPVHIPAQVTGNTINVIGILNPAICNVSVNR